MREPTLNEVWLPVPARKAKSIKLLIFCWYSEVKAKVKVRGESIE